MCHRIGLFQLNLLVPLFVFFLPLAWPLSPATSGKVEAKRVRSPHLSLLLILQTGLRPIPFSISAPRNSVEEDPIPIVEEEETEEEGAEPTTEKEIPKPFLPYHLYKQLDYTTTRGFSISLFSIC